MVLTQSARRSPLQVLMMALLMLLIGLGLAVPVSPQAHAAIRSFEEQPGQWLYQSRSTLQAAGGQQWQAIAYKRVTPLGALSIQLRLVGFPGAASILRDHPLLLKQPQGETLIAQDTSATLFSESDQPEPYVGQYDLLPIVADLRPELPLELELATQTGEILTLPIPAFVIQEWQDLLAA
ncbi:DUF3122 domain-containing protein [Lyngbya confervoides]|uniref:DUF3122 domain-containing protein n=1 Tax=Lyngbya confervoides BDU141951 TaxID=1574623 RepID=A0ABD4T1S3_9CYAN|nr:DUF3122 domain-containing protein [Lyngbya confervoides]MCM1982448.1 DUF3122 domain-containing protein [Lyngbya confervoides BDU141951]